MSDGPIVLYVDDEKPNRIVFEQSFTEAFDVVVCDSAEAALEVMKEREVAVLVTDQRMPGMTGNELLEIAKETHPTTIRIVITAYSDLDPILRAVNDGLVARYIVKPWVRRDVHELLEWGMDAYLLGRDNSATQARLLSAERMASLGNITASLIHELNQPLAYIMSGTERFGMFSNSADALKQLLDNHGDELDPTDAGLLFDLASEFRELVEDMTVGCQLMRGLTDNVRRLFRPPRPGEAKQAEPVQLIKFAMTVCRHLAIRGRGDVVYDGPEELPLVAMGATEFAQVVINLVSNASQALSRREGTGGRVWIRAVDSGRNVEVHVRDNGPGMPREVLEKLGDQFFTTREEGTGLGINQSHRLVEAVHGKLEFESTPGEGTTATLRIPKVA